MNRMSRGIVLGLLLVLGTVTLLAQGPTPAVVQQAIRALLAGTAVVSGNWTCTGTCTGFGGAGTIGGSIASGQVATGSGVNTIAGTDAFTWSNQLLYVQQDGTAGVNAASFNAYSQTNTPRGLFASADSESADPIDHAYAMETKIYNDGSGALANAIAIRVGTNINDGGGSITNNYGIKVENQTSGATNYAIFTGTGPVKFGDTVQSTGYKSSDGSAGVTVAVCTSFKNGLCVAGT